ncbi:preprotein translocase subunit SecE [Desulfobulbus oligotrophicus]|jgi:preprotein translocase subunit SecE|uniref:Protein translocase subunit SecE n=1 Tax=Desulfobulbus oligotrophicus TaxID=1909699 RepID=A0A7T5VD76_9BACT|nr:preprotein translocase subunit SecE [Desulfobulbus oligotrophicus]MDY0391108.1 preprotein translocase subunit SecE [Desulfobulbus oligotrophicus]QQG65713.1 preprotein translocase subunit SecE [Desulfobulbus oligotrophicus]
MSKAEIEAKKGGGDLKVRSPFHPFRIKQFLQEVYAEFRKIVWPAKKTTAGLTGFVILLVVIISLYLGSVDLLLGKLVATVLN